MGTKQLHCSLRSKLVSYVIHHVHPLPSISGYCSAKSVTYVSDQVPDLLRLSALAPAGVEGSDAFLLGRGGGITSAAPDLMTF